MTDYQITTDDAEVARLTANGDAHRELSILSKYPPFSLYSEKRDMLAKAMIDASMEIGMEEQKTGKTPENGYASVMTKFADDLDEARLYQKRYGENWREAQQSAMKIDKIDSEDDGLYREYE